MANEENWRGNHRVEVKSGQYVQGVSTLFLKAEAQAENSKAIGDSRPFVCIAMPKGWGSEGLVIQRLSTWQK